MSLEDKLNSSFLSKVRGSIAKPFFPLITAGVIALTGCSSGSSSDNNGHCGSDMDCPGNEICVEQVCSSYGSGTNIKEAITNQNGLVTFIDDEEGEEVNVFVKDEEGNPISNAQVAFYDGNGFETYQVEHSDFVPYLHIFSHNSTQNLVLSTSPLQFNLYDGPTDSKSNSENAARKFSKHLKENSESSTCITVEEFDQTRRDRQSALIDFTNLVPNVGDDLGDIITYTSDVFFGTVKSIIDILKENGYGENDCQYFRSWNGLRPSQQSMGPIFNYDCMHSIPQEICDNGIDDDCDRQVDWDDTDCDPGNRPNPVDECNLTSGCNDNDCVFYDDFSGNELNECKWFTINNDGLSVSGNKLRMSPADGSETIRSNHDFDYFSNHCNGDLELEFKQKLSLEKSVFILSFNDIKFHYNALNDGNAGYGCFNNFPGGSGFSDFNPTQWNTIKLVKSGDRLNIYINGSSFGYNTCNLSNQGNWGDHIYVSCSLFSDDPNDYCELDNIKLTCD